ncbi:MAG: hypothetical protein QOE11_1037 [Solirubrobacteraceae bacterium]|jgi:hypothetical protein|nr:hypothetical protein [Solirubrobacteraceae bacterium]
MRLLRRPAEIITARRAVGAFVLAAAIAPIAAADAQSSSDDSRRLWATVNVCDTERWPDTIGIRGSMPGSGDDRGTLWMRFQVQFQSPDDGLWHNVPEGGDSGFVLAGSGRAKARQAGRSFRISPKKGEQVLLRGRVSFEWRLKDVVTRSASMRTAKGHRSSAGSDPPGYTASTCTVTPDS